MNDIEIIEIVAELKRIKEIMYYNKRLGIKKLDILIKKLMG